MNIEEFRDFCLKKPFVSEEFPFGPETLVYKVSGKVFALCGLDEVEFSVNLKCDPQYAEELRENYSEIKPGYHMNKKHWNTVSFEGNLTDELLHRLIDHSYQKVIESFSKKKRQEMGF